MKYQNAELVKCVEREIALRVRVYARRVSEGKMLQETAAREIEMMRQVLEIVKAQEKELFPR